ncbi:MAG: hypothetical protein ACYDGM_09570 [Vulcanimicrobiaceae bacterium]
MTILLSQGKLAAVATFALVLSGCGGGGGTSASLAGGGTPLGPTPTTETVTVQAQSTSVPLPAISGYTGTIVIPSGSGTVSIASMTQPPAGIPVPSGITPLMYVTFSASGGAVMMAQTPGFNVDMSNMMGSATYYMAYYQSGTWTTVEGPAMMSGTSMMMSSATASMSLQPGQTECFAYYAGSPLGMPSAAPTSMASMTP